MPIYRDTGLTNPARCRRAEAYFNIIRWVVPMNRQATSRLQSDLSKLLSHLLEEDVALSEMQARQIAIQINPVSNHPLDMSTYSIIPDGK